MAREQGDVLRRLRPHRGALPLSAGGPAPVGALEDARRLRASHALRSLRRSSSDLPPHTPDSWLVARANSRHASCASHGPADRLGGLDLLHRLARRAYREEQVGVGVTTGCVLAPVLGVPVDGPVPRKGHYASSPPLGSRRPPCDLIHKTPLDPFALVVAVGQSDATSRTRGR